MPSNFKQDTRCFEHVFPPDDGDTSEEKALHHRLDCILLCQALAGSRKPLSINKESVMI